MHTPYSFSAFDYLSQALDMAKTEGVSVVGINDFYTAAGYDEWEQGCKERKLYPLFNIELISLNEEDRDAGLRVNDPGNPGRTYLSGKGLTHPFRLADPYATQLQQVRGEANGQVEKMCDKLNEILQNINADFSLDFHWIKEDLTKGLVRERHLAKALRMKVYEAYGFSTHQVEESQHAPNKKEIADHVNNDIKTLFLKVFNGKELKSSISDFAGVENEIRANLLKAGGAAFVPEDARAFLPVQEVCNIILAAGGIPTYPFLADDAQGNYTDFEADLVEVADVLTQRGFHSVEFITTRNDVQLLEKYASYLHDQGFVVTLGSEHNTPAMEPIELFARNSTPLTEKLMQINYEGACVVAAHQHLVAQGLAGYVDEHGGTDRGKREEFVKLGNQVIQAALV